MKKLIIISSVILIITATHPVSTAENETLDSKTTQMRGGHTASGALTLWYSKPATEWTDALPLGNGRLGAMVYGGIEQEHL